MIPSEPEPSVSAATLNVIFQVHNSALAAEISVALATGDGQPVEDCNDDELPTC